MKPVDPRLVRYAGATQVFLLLSVLLGVVGAGLVIVQAMLVAEVVVGAFQHGRGLAGLGWQLAGLAGVGLLRGAVSWGTETAAHRASAQVKSQLRARLLGRATALGPGWLSGRRSGELVTLATRGVDALDDYFARYLPQLALAVVVPVAVIARILFADWLSALIIVLTLPLVPVFMVLIGLATQSRMDRQWRTLGRLSHHFLDVVAGLPTLKVFGRAKAQAEAIRRTTDEYRRATMRTLRIAFISSFALELLSTISVALVAVGIGMRLVDGSLDLYTGLLVLVLAPEAYLPIRQVGTHYHASVEGLAAAEQIFAVLETPVAAAGTVTAPLRPTIELDQVTVAHAPGVRRLSLTVRPGETLAVTGVSGAGKTTLLSLLLGFTAPTSGAIRVDGRPPADLADWHDRIAWVPQHPYLFAGTVADNVRLARPDATDTELVAALRSAHAWEFVSALPLGTASPLGENGQGLSAGQRQRLALARAFLADRPLVLLDEPTANLDGESETAIVDAIRELARDGRRTVILTAHRPALLALATRHLALTVQPSDDAAHPEPVLLRAAGGPDSLAGPTVVAARSVADRSVADGPESAPGRVAAAATARQGLDGANALDPFDPFGPFDPEHASATVGERAPHPGEAPVRDGAPAQDGAPVGEGVPVREGLALRRVRRAARTRRLRTRTALAVTLAALALLSATALMGTSGWLIDRASQQPPVLYLMVAVTAVRTFGTARSALRYAERLVSHDAVFRALGSLRSTVYQRLERLAPNGGGGRLRGDLLSRMVGDVDAIQDYVLRFRLPAAAAFLASAVTVGVVGWLLPAAGVLLALGLLLAGVAVPMLTVRLSARAERAQAGARGRLAAEVVGVLDGAAELTVSGALPRCLDRLRATDAELTALARRSAAGAGVGTGLGVALTGLTAAACAAAGVLAVADGSLSGVLLAVLVLTPLAAFEAITGLPVAAQVRRRSAQSAVRVLELVDAPDPVREPVEPQTLPARPLPLRVRGLSARWPGRRTLALDGIDLDLTEGRRVAVVGPSGSGKTTLAQLLLRFLDAESGSVTLNGVDTAALDGDEVRTVVGICAQDGYIFDSSLRENLRLARPACEEAELWAALAAARLDGWVRELPDGLDTMVGEHGARISGGQRQRLALARALLADFPVLVLDEPAEHLDLATADALTADLLTATTGRSTLLVTHRLAGLDAVDEILVLDAGRIVQRGSWDQLVEAEGPLRRMWAREREADALLPA
ncbi:thiol reductant ABC exporter subunit CydD [Streptacidiphilus sp. EB129]|uniref:thiol reductant ABC exporter subunit CydD n=1 Tax=Streptacidiphilus sp. EB129 TaxID=3156262 RepID=UPI0035178E40